MNITTLQKTSALDIKQPRENRNKIKKIKMEAKIIPQKQLTWSPLPSAPKLDFSLLTLPISISLHFFLLGTQI